MARKKTSHNDDKTSFLRNSSLHGTYKDLQRKAISLGMPFPDVPGSGVFDLISYINNSNNKPDPSKIDEYDKWLQHHFDLKGIPQDDPIRNSRLRLGFLGDEDENGKIRRKRVPGIKKQSIKKPRERDEFKLIKGTKKSYTYELTKKGYDLDRVIRRVKKKFPEANDKSIRLWYRACLKTTNK